MWEGANLKQVKSATGNTTSSGHHTSGHQPPASTSPAPVASQQSRVLDVGGREAGWQGGREAGWQGGRDQVDPAPAQASVPARGWLTATPSSVPAAACTAVSRPTPAAPPHGVQASGGGGGGGGGEGGGGGGERGGGEGGQNVLSSSYVCNMYIIDCPDDVTGMNDGPTAKMARHDSGEISDVTSRQPLDASSVQAAACDIVPPHHHEHTPNEKKRSSDDAVAPATASRCSHTVADMSRWDDPGRWSFRSDYVTGHIFHANTACMFDGSDCVHV